MMPVLNYSENKFGQTGSFRNQPFHMTQLKMAVAVYETGRKDSFEFLHISTRLTGWQDIKNLSVFPHDKNMGFIQKPVAIKQKICLEFPYRHFVKFLKQ